MEDVVVRGVSIDRKQAKLTVDDVCDEPGIAARILGLVPSIIFGGAMTIGNMCERRTTRIASTDATTAFQGGTGDVLLSYENEAIEARQAGADFDYIIPDQTLLIQNTGAVTTKASKAAKDFLGFQLSKQGQTDYAKQGFRPLDTSVKVDVPGANDPSNPFPAPKTLLTIDKDFGGWSVANTKYFDEKTGIVTKLLAASGKA